MNIILPNYMLRRKDFVCGRCGFKFYKNTPSRVEKCPKCSLAVFDVTYKKGESLDPYSEAKLRWYSDPSGERHADEIRHRKLQTINNKKVAAVTDDKGRVIDYMPDFDVKGTNIGTKKAEGKL